MPQKRHESIESAQAEARRLAKLKPGTEFFVLRAMESVRYSENPYTVTKYAKKKEFK